MILSLSAYSKANARTITMKKQSGIPKLTCVVVTICDARTDIVPLRPGPFLGVAAHW
jgi:hypothetical protein